MTLTLANLTNRMIDFQSLIVAFTTLPLLLHAQNDKTKSPQVEILIRCDDIGMCHAVNTAIKEVR